MQFSQSTQNSDSENRDINASFSEKEWPACKRPRITQEIENTIDVSKINKTSNILTGN